MSWADPALLQQLPLFLAAALVLNATPGVDLLLTVTRTAQGGARAGALAACGIAAGCAAHALAAAFGLAALLAWSAGAFTVIKWVGAAYLVWLGWGMLCAAWRGAAALPAAADDAPRATALAEFRRGLLTNLLNPKVALFMLAFLPQFVPAQLPYKTPALLMLGALFVLQGLLFLLAVVWLTARLARWPALTGSGRWLQGLSGVLFFALAARLAGSRLGSPG